MGFKEDADFSRFVSIGAVGTAAVARDLAERGHRPIECERYAMANKVWQTKVKRLRLPDLLCTRCGLRVESRAKSKLGIVVSHSEVEGREWDAGGMRTGDLYAFLRADLGEFPPATGRPWYFTTKSLQESAMHAKRSAPKAASEGSEVTLTWPTWVPKKSGVLVEIDDESRIVCEWDDGTRYRYWQWKRWPSTGSVYLEPGSGVDADETIVAGLPKVADAIGCSGDTWDLRASLSAADESDRFAAIKAAGITGRRDLTADLAALADDDAEDWRIQLEALAALARLEPEDWTRRIAAIANDEFQDAPTRMEAVFVLSEIPTVEAAESLASTAAVDEAPTELRAAAAWGLGQGSFGSPHHLLPLTIDGDDFVALHAITAFEELPDDLVEELVEWLAEDDDRRAPVAAQLLQRHRKVMALLDACEMGGGARLRALRSLGDLPPPFVRLAAGDRLFADLAEILAPMWVGQEDWLREEQAADGLVALDIQKVRYDPAQPDS